MGLEKLQPIVDSKRYNTVDSLDACGKGTLLLGLQEKYGIVVVKTPPPYMERARKAIDDADLRMRFIFYSVGNMLVNYQVGDLLKKGNYVMQDRSWLSTLSAHELRGVSNRWLSIGENLAGSCICPNVALIVHVAKEERVKRLNGRGYLTEADKQNLQFEEKMEQCYQQWANRLGWHTLTFDNTQYNVPQAIDALAHVLYLDKK